MMDPSSMIYGALLVGGFEGARMGFMRWLRGREQRAFQAGHESARLLPAATETVSPLQVLGRPVGQMRDYDDSGVLIVRPVGLSRKPYQLGPGK